MPPMPTAWWLRPLSRAARVGEHNAVVWKRVYFSPVDARRSAVGMRHGPPKAGVVGDVPRMTPIGDRQDRPLEAHANSSECTVTAQRTSALQKIATADQTG